MSKKITDCMVDIETLGTDANSIILSIGAIGFNPFTLHSTKSFYTVINTESCKKHNLKLSPETYTWWCNQKNNDIIQQAETSTVTLENALHSFNYYLQNFCMGPDTRIWGNGASFDNAILKFAYSSIGWVSPWRYNNDRCFRTIRAMYPKVSRPQTTVTHNAEDDAIQQFLHLKKILRKNVLLRLRLR